MMTVITEVTLEPGSEPEWDAAMRDRLTAARGRPGWVSGQLLIPLDSQNKRVVVGTWQSRADWQAWHEDETFAETRARMEGLQKGGGATTWHEVVVDARGDAERPSGKRG
jgi:heme-degrading monooxygenase HmoA